MGVSFDDLDPDDGEAGLTSFSSSALRSSKPRSQSLIRERTLLASFTQGGQSQSTRSFVSNWLNKRSVTSSKPSRSNADFESESDFTEVCSGATGLTGKSDATAIVRRSIAFADFSLLRGSKLSTVLQRGGHILESSAGSEQTYEMSRVVDHIDDFISHNWSTPRSLKFLTLVLHYNMQSATLLTTLCMFITALVTLAELVPMAMILEDAYGPSGVLCQACAAPVFFAVLLLQQESRLFRRCADSNSMTSLNRIVFLDKTCIHQTDPVIKAEGIQKLGAFLTFSDTMVVVYTDVYLRRLWTVYEVASFLLINARGRMVLLPAVLSPLLLVILVWMYAMGLTSRGVSVLVATGSSTRFVQNLVWAPIPFILTWRLRSWNRELLKIKRTMQEFDVRKADCFCEGDRPVVQKSIIAFMRKLLLVPEGLSPEEVLEEFNDIARTDLPVVLKISVGRAGLPYWRFSVLLSLFSIVPFSLDRVSVFYLSTASGNPGIVRRVVLYILYILTQMFTVAPLTVGLISKLTKRHYFQGWKEVAYLLLVVSSSIVTFGALSYLSWDVMYEYCLQFDYFIILWLVYCAILSATTWQMYRPVHVEKQDRMEALSSLLTCAGSSAAPSDFKTSEISGCDGNDVSHSSSGATLSLSKDLNFCISEPSVFAPLSPAATFDGLATRNDYTAERAEHGPLQPHILLLWVGHSSVRSGHETPLPQLCQVGASTASNSSPDRKSGPQPVCLGAAAPGGAGAAWRRRKRPSKF